MRLARLFPIWAVALAVALGPSGAAAAEATPESDSSRLEEDPWAGVEELVVTGTGGVNLSNITAASVVAFDADYIEAIGASDIGDLAQATPSLSIKRQSASSGSLFVRGVGLDDSRVNAASAVAVVYDGIYFNSQASQLSQIYDVQGVEILRGPQGTLNGRNATAGAILVKSNVPSGDFGAELKGTYGRFNQIETEGFLEAPILPDLLAVRTSFKVSRRDPIGRNRCGGPNPLPETRCTFQEALKYQGPFQDVGFPEEGVNDKNSWAARAVFKFDPLVDMSWLLNVHGTQNRSLAPSFQKIGNKEARTVDFGTPSDSFNYYDPDLVVLCPRRFAISTGSQCRALPPPIGQPAQLILANRPEKGDPFEGDYNRTGPEDVDAWGLSLNGQWTVGRLEITSAAGYEWVERFISIDGDASPFVALEAESEDTTWQVSEELRLYWDLDEVDFTLGMHVLHESLRARNVFRTELTGALSGGAEQQLDQDTNYVGIFFEPRWRLSEAIEFEAGVRLNWEQKVFRVLGIPFRDRITGIGPDPALGNQFFRGSATGTIVEPTGHAKLRWLPTEDFETYIKYTRALKGQHFNGGATSRGSLIRPAEPETVDGLELGIRSAWLDGMLRVNGAAFYQSYENQHVFQVQNGEGQAPINQLINANASRILGIEADFEISYEGFGLFVTASYIFSEYSDFTNIVENERTELAGGVPVIVVDFELENFSGNRLVSNPEFELSGFVEYARELGRLGKLTPRLDFSYRSEMFFTPRNHPQLGDDELFTLNARLTYQSPDGFIEMALWVRNLTDEIYPLAANDFERSNDSFAYFIADPRTYGATATLRFGR